ncbi:MAG TPA: HAD-IIB family hydrolase, partial [Tissierellaceae bacterium]
MSYKLIAIDMDGTLLNDDNLIGENTQKALRKATLNGKYTVFATGRMMKSAMNYANRLNLNKPIISCNGAIITNKDKEIIFGGNIDHDVVRKVDQIARKYNTYYHFYSEDKLYTSNYFEKINEFYNKNSKGDEVI